MKELTILLPCLNEAETLAVCIKRAHKLLHDHAIDGEILVSDNGSTDESQAIAKDLGTRLVHCPIQGYGAALQFGIEHAEGQFVLMGDSDDSYHFDEAFPMIEELRRGFDVCMGSRLRGTIMPDAMPLLNRYVGNPILTTIGKVLFKTDISDFHCGMRAFRKDAILALNLVTTGMEWASEMIAKACLSGLKMTEVPINLYKDGRSRPPHLKRWRDAWRHTRFMMLHSPKWLFIIPGLIMIMTGLLGELMLLPGMFTIDKVNFDVHSLLVMSFLVIIGTQTAVTGIFAVIYGYTAGILPRSDKIESLIRKLTLEKLLIACLVLGSAGLGGFIYTLWQWYEVNFSSLDYQVTMRQLIPSLTVIAIAVQGGFNGCMLSILFLKTKRTNTYDF
jgi:glycosyltransferase involved in cell wall biosynthesis